MTAPAVVAPVAPSVAAPITETAAVPAEVFGSALDRIIKSAPIPENPAGDPAIAVELVLRYAQARRTKRR